MSSYYTDIYPLTVVSDRYGGTYSGGDFTAWNMYPDEVPYEISSDDCTCLEKWTELRSGDGTERRELFGVGNTPNDAVLDLERKMARSKR